MSNDGTHLVHCETALLISLRFFDARRRTSWSGSVPPRCSLHNSIVDNKVATSWYTLIAFSVTASTVLLKSRSRFIPQ
jgi:hypothetical protein